MTIVINDLEQNKELDSVALAKVCGGKAIFANKPQHILPRQPQRHGPLVILPGNLFKKSLGNVSNQINIAVNSQNVIQGNSNAVSQF